MDVRFRQRGAPIALALAFALVAAACSSGGSPSPSSPASASTAASQSASASASFDPLAPYPSKPGNLPVVKFAQDVPVLSFAPAIIAREMNFFEYEGVKLAFIQLQSGATSLQAMISGSVDLVNSGSTNLAAGYLKGTDFEAIENSSFTTLEFCISNVWTQQHNITAASTLQQRMAAMKGVTIGITGPGADSDLDTRFLFKKYGNLDPNKDAVIVQIGGAAALTAALENNQIQGFLQSAPTCESTKNATVLVRASEVPEWQNFPFHIVYGTRTWLAAHKDVATAVATATAMGGDFILKYPDAALKLLQKDFSTTDPTIVADSFNQSIKPQVPPGGTFAQAMWQQTGQWLIDNGISTKPIDTSEGVLWTNQYIVDAVVK